MPNRVKLYYWLFDNVKAKSLKALAEIMGYEGIKLTKKGYIHYLLDVMAPTQTEKPPVPQTPLSIFVAAKPKAPLYEDLIKKVDNLQSLEIPGIALELSVADKAKLVECYFSLGKIEFIKHLRAIYGYGLKESKDLMDEAWEWISKN